MGEGVVITSMREACEMMADSKVADVKSLFDTHINDGKVVVVEGPDDKEVYEKVMKPDAVCIYPDCNCEKHFVILKALNSRYGNRLLAIKDADFDRLDGITHPYPNLVLTDTHDMEGMIVEECLSALEGDDAKRCKDTVIGEIYDELEDISYFKWFNHVNHHGINFREVTIDLDLTTYFSACVAKTDNVVNVTLEDVYKFKNAHSGVPKRELSNGHDIFERIYVRAHVSGVGNYPKKPFFRRFRRAYPQKAFFNTELFRMIQAWQSANGCAVLAES